MSLVLMVPVEEAGLYFSSSRCQSPGFGYEDLRIQRIAYGELRLLRKPLVYLVQGPFLFQVERAVRLVFEGESLTPRCVCKLDRLASSASVVRLLVKTISANSSR